MGPKQGSKFDQVPFQQPQIFSGRLFYLQVEFHWLQSSMFQINKISVPSTDWRAIFGRPISQVGPSPTTQELVSITLRQFKMDLQCNESSEHPSVPWEGHMDADKSVRGPKRKLQSPNKWTNHNNTQALRSPPAIHREKNKRGTEMAGISYSVTKITGTFNTTSHVNVNSRDPRRYYLLYRLRN